MVDTAASTEGSDTDLLIKPGRVLRDLEEILALPIASPSDTDGFSIRLDEVCMKWKNKEYEAIDFPPIPLIAYVLPKLYRGGGFTALEGTEKARVDLICQIADKHDIFVGIGKLTCTFEGDGEELREEGLEEVSTTCVVDNIVARTGEAFVKKIKDLDSTALVPQTAFADSNPDSMQDGLDDDDWLDMDDYEYERAVALHGPPSDKLLRNWREGECPYRLSK